MSAADGNNKKRKKEDEAAQVADKAVKWAEEFEKLDEDDQYTYLEEIAPRMNSMHLQFLQGIIGFEDDDGDEFDDGEEDEDGGEDDEDDEDDDEEDENGEGDDA